MLKNIFSIEGLLGFLKGPVEKHIEGAFEKAIKKDFLDEAALAWALALAERANAGVTAKAHAILGKLNEYEQEQQRFIIMNLVAFDKERMKTDENWPPISVDVLNTIVKDLEGKDAKTIKERLTLIDSPFWTKVWNDHIAAHWPTLQDWMKRHYASAINAAYEALIGKDAKNRIDKSYPGADQRERRLELYDAESRRATILRRAEAQSRKSTFFGTLFDLKSPLTYFFWLPVIITIGLMLFHKS
jgi:hypothetical protein